MILSEEQKEIVHDCIKRSVGNRVDQIHEDMDLNTYNVDSFNMIEILMSLEQAFDIAIDDEELVHMKSIRGIYNVIGANLSQKAIS